MALGKLSILKGSYEKDGKEHFSRAYNDRTNGNCFKLTEGRLTLEIRKKFFLMRELKHCQRLPRVVDASSLETLKVRLDSNLT